MGKMNQGPLPERVSFVTVAHAENTRENREGIGKVVDTGKDSKNLIQRSVLNKGPGVGEE
jgi:hypothetical protein